MNAKGVLAAAAQRVAVTLKDRNFKRRGLKFVRSPNDGFVSLIELQSSRKSTSEQLSFAINFGVIVPVLFGGEDLTNPNYTECHWGGRILSNDGIEAWWSVRAHDDVEQLAARLTALLTQDVLPRLDAMQLDDDLVSLWKTGQSPLLAEVQRLLFLGTLLHRLGRREEFEEVKADLECKARDSFSQRAIAKLKALDG